MMQNGTEDLEHDLFELSPHERSAPQHLQFINTKVVFYANL
jgi:hypothetical protein